LCLTRVVKRDGCSLESAKRRLAAQLPQKEKERRSDWVIVNDGSLEDLRRRVIAFYRQITDPGKRQSSGLSSM